MRNSQRFQPVPSVNRGSCHDVLPIFRLYYGLKFCGPTIMRVVTIIQARMGSTRLPGKVLLDLDGKTVLARVVERVRRSRTTASQVIVATTSGAGDNPVVEECHRLGVETFRGSEDDVLDRYYQAASRADAEVVVRICSDCPLIDPELIDRTVEQFLASSVDYASNALDRTYPRGLDVEVLTYKALERCWREAKLLYQRSHVTAYIYENPRLFGVLRVTGKVDHSGHRWTLDTLDDYQFMQAVYERISDQDHFSWRDVLELLGREPELAELNRHVVQKALQAG
jgi:spore coat polysaccharide biosynthesis protein SpsF